jgi:ketosteroid isomerase-like protein
MSEEDVERVRASYEFVDREHEPDFDLLHPDIRWHTRADLPDTATHRGHDGAATLLAEWFGGAFDDVHVDVEEVIDAGGRVVVVLRLRGRVRDSAHEVSMSETHVLTMRDGKVIEIHEYPTKAEALKAVGLDE